MKILKFGAIWCPGCLVMKPMFKKIEEEIEGLQTEYFEYDECEEEVTKWNIGRKLPVFIFIDKEGNEITRLIGEQKKEKVIELILENINK